MKRSDLPALLFIIMLLTAGCSATRWEEGPEPPAGSNAPANQDMARSKRGNPPFYKVYGVRYTVLDSSSGYKERGVASWYGKKFHGRQTSSGEPYDMHRMTAAHKTLPLPTNARVTNLKNGRSIVVRINDRGPFVKNRLIDLSYAAARDLDMIGAGTALVEVEALNTSYGNALASPVAVKPAAGVPEHAVAEAPRMFVQVGAFGEADNARNLATRLTDRGVNRVSVLQPAAEAPILYKVRIGPFNDISDYDRIVAQMEKLEISNTHLVVEDDQASNN